GRSDRDHALAEGARRTARRSDGRRRGGAVYRARDGCPPGGGLMVREMPAWAEELRRRYLRGEASQFILHGNVNDLVLHGEELLGVSDFLSRALLAPTKEVVATYNLSSGVTFTKKSAAVGSLE